MRETILTCDRCKEKVKNLIEVGAGERKQHYSSSYGRGNSYYEVNQLVAEWCLDCCIEMHIAKPCTESETKPIESLPTLEDMIREIIREEIEDKS
mgnify:CR=1 FL=1